MGTIETEIGHGEVVFEETKPVVEVRPDARFTPAEVLERVSFYFSVPPDQLVGSGKKTRISDVKSLTTVLLHHYSGLEHPQIAEVMELSDNYISTMLGRGRRLLREDEQWQAFHRELTAENPPELPLIDQYLAGFCTAYQVSPDMLTEPAYKTFLIEARHSLLYRLQTETPIPLEKLCQTFSISKVNSLSRMRERAEALFSRDPAAAKRALAVERGDRLPAFSSSPDSYIDHALAEAGITLDTFRNPDDQHRRVSQARQWVIRQLYFRTPLGPKKIGELTGVGQPYVNLIAETQGPVEESEAAPGWKRRFDEEAQRFSSFYGMPLETYEKQSIPHQILVYALTERGLLYKEIAETTGLGDFQVGQVTQGIERRLAEDPHFKRIFEAARSDVQPRGGLGLISAVMEVSARRAGTTVDTLVYRPNTEAGSLARNWAAHLLRNRVGLKVEQIRKRTGKSAADTLRRGWTAVAHEVATSDDAAAVEDFLWKCILREHRPHETGDAVLCFPCPDEREVCVGEVIDVRQGQDERIAVIKAHRTGVEHSIPLADPTVLDAESAAVVVRDPRLLDVWFFGRSLGTFSQRQMREALSAESGQLRIPDA